MERSPQVSGTGPRADLEATPQRFDRLVDQALNKHITTSGADLTAVESLRSAGQETRQGSDRLPLVVDQFEEIFSPDVDENTRQPDGPVPRLRGALHAGLHDGDLVPGRAAGAGIQGVAATIAVDSTARLVGYGARRRCDELAPERQVPGPDRTR